MTASRVWRPARMTIASNAVGSVVLVLAGFVIGGISLAGAAPGWLVVVSMAPSLIGFWWLARVRSARVEIHSDRLIAVGFLWTRTIRRSQVLMVIDDPSVPCVMWRSSIGIPVATFLTTVMTGELGASREGTARRKSFLDEVSRWAQH